MKAYIFGAILFAVAVLGLGALSTFVTNLQPPATPEPTAASSNPGPPRPGQASPGAQATGTAPAAVTLPQPTNPMMPGPMMPGQKSPAVQPPLAGELPPAGTPIGPAKPIEGPTPNPTPTPVLIPTDSSPTAAKAQLH